MEFHPQSAPVPERHRTDRLSLQPLRVTDVERDYDAVMSSRATLRRWSQSDWPADDFTLAGNRADLERHEREHLERVAFTFTVLDTRDERCLGCVYLMPLRREEAELFPDAGHGTRVGFWVRESERSTGLEEHLLATLREWMTAAWAFDAVAFTVYEKDARQAAVLAACGLTLRRAFTLPDGRACRVFT